MSSRATAGLWKRIMCFFRGCEAFSWAGEWLECKHCGYGERKLYGDARWSQINGRWRR
jgi:hypothetical protein